MLRRLMCFLLICILGMLLSSRASAGEGTAYTYTISVNGDWVRTQDAYLPGQILFNDGTLRRPYDIDINGDYIYIADAGNSCVVRYDMKTEEILRIGEGILKGPRGVFVTDEGRCYVADYDAQCVVVFSQGFDVELVMPRPESYLFSDSSRYKPTGVAATSSGIIYVVGEGSYEGIMQFSPAGEFQGYYAANKADISLLQRVQDLIFSEEQLERLLTRAPRAIYSIDIDDMDLVFSVTQDAAVSYEWREAAQSGDNNVKRHNFAGDNILRREGMTQEWNFVDIAVGPYGGCYALTSTGLINEYDSAGNLVFSFGGRAVVSDRSGLFTAAAAIDTDDNGCLYVLDMERGFIQVFYPTQFADTTHTALAALSSGDYAQSEQLWIELLGLNGMSYLAHYGYAKSLFAQQRFDEALEQYRIARDVTGYSESFWELRDAWLSRWIAPLLTGLIIVFIFYRLGRGLYRKHRAKTPVVKKLPGKTRQNFRLALSMLRHPIDGFYYMKYENKGSIGVATALYAAALGIWFWDRLFRGFVFNPVNLRLAEPITVALLFIIPVGLWVTGNYFVSSISEGEGKFKVVYISTAYALTPYIVLMPIPLLLSYVLTLNEQFVITLSTVSFLAWSGVLVCVGISQVQDFTIKQTVKNILLTIFFMVMVVVIFVVLYLIWRQVLSFFSSVGGEVYYRVSAF